MKRVVLFSVFVAGAMMCFTSCGESAGSKSSDEAAATEVENPCDCLGKDLDEGQRRYCRESKRYTSFLEALRNCGLGEVGGVSAVGKMPDDGQYTMDTGKSIVEWKGSKAGMAEKGSITVRSCTFTVESGRLDSGSMIVEMNAIQATSQTGQAARDLAQHLRSEDFFDVAQFPTAAYTVVSSRTDGRGNLLLSGKLNIKGKSKELDALMTFASADPVVASINLTFDRADFDVRFGSGSFFDNLGDNLISDMVDVRMALIEDVAARKFK